MRTCYLKHKLGMVFNIAEVIDRVLLFYYFFVSIIFLFTFFATKEDIGDISTSGNLLQALDSDMTGINQTPGLNILSSSYERTNTSGTTSTVTGTNNENLVLPYVFSNMKPLEFQGSKLGLQPIKGNVNQFISQNDKIGTLDFIYAVFSFRVYGLPEALGLIFGLLVYLPITLILVMKAISVTRGN